MRLPSQPGNKSVGTVVVPGGDEASICADRHGKHRRLRCHVSQATLQQGLDIDALLMRIIFDGEQPRIQDRAQGAGLNRSGAQGFDAAPVDRFELMQWGIDLVDLDLGDRETLPHRAVGQPAGEERFARTVFAANGFEHRAAAGNHVEFGVEFAFEPAETDGELVESIGGHRAAPQCVEDLRGGVGQTPAMSLRSPRTVL